MNQRFAEGTRTEPLSAGEAVRIRTPLLDRYEGDLHHTLELDIDADKYVERCKQRAFDYLERGDLKNAVASFVSNMNARPDCELPHYLATLGVSLLMRNDALGWRTLIEGLR